MPSILSPDVDSEAFSTPPTSPMPNGALLPSLSRRNSRPSTLRIDQSQPDWSSDSVLEEQSPDSAKIKGLRQKLTPLVPPNTAVRLQSPLTAMPGQMQPLASPCFVHSHLDKGASLADWLRIKQSQTNGNNDVGLSKSLRWQDGRYQPISNQKSHVFGVQYPDSPSSDALGDEEDVGSLTRQLAETAVGVREMSKQLGEQSLWNDGDL